MFGTRMMRVGKWITILAGLAVTFVVSFGIAMRVAARSREVIVPDIVGRSINDASAVVAELGLTLTKEETRRINPSVPADHIVEQEPAAGTRTRQPRRVRIWLSAGQRAAHVPGVVGETERNAQLRLQNDGFEVPPSIELRSRAHPAGVVIAQSPPPDSSSDRVALLVNRGDEATSFVMPDLIGTSADRAADYLRGKGFRVAITGSQPYPGIPPGIVIRHMPRAGFQIVPGQPISIEVSQ